MRRRKDHQLERIVSSRPTLSYLIIIILVSLKAKAKNLDYPALNL